MDPAKFFINGEFRSSSSKRPVCNPFDNTVVGEVFQAEKSDIEQAVEVAADAFGRTRLLTAFDRSLILATIAAGIHEQREKFAQSITAETGKPISFSRTEVERSIFTFTVASEEAKRIEGTVLPLDIAGHSNDRVALVRRFPLGPVAGITPFNFPLNLVAHKVGPAIASGNSIVLKPSSKAPLVALLLAQVVLKSKLPKGAFNVVPCLGGEAEQLILDERIKLISFTGSPAVGWRLKSRAGKKRVLLELGGNAAVIVDRGANMDYALKRIAQGAYGNAGQSCISVQRIFVHDSLFAQFTEQFVKLTKAIATGNPLNERTVVGPMIDEEAAQKVHAWIREAEAAGAQVLCGGKRSGALLHPTVLTGVTPEMKVSCQEVFAPVVTLTSFSDFKDAVSMVNNSSFGLQAGVFTNDFENVFYAYRELEVGGVIINDSSTYRMDHMPYGGVKDSGFGREGIRYAIEEMTEMKLLGLNFPSTQT